MTDISLTVLLATVVTGAAPIVLASMGETVTEKAGLINLSLDGSIMLSSMCAFAAAYGSGSLFLGFAAGALVGAVVALIVAVFSIHLSRNQVAVGFVLTLMAKDLAYFLGNPLTRLKGPVLDLFPIPVLENIPFLGPIFFRQNPAVYFSFVLIFGCWWLLYHTPAGLKIRAVGEHPAAAFARGIDPGKIQLICAVAGGLLVGLAGAAFSLSVKPGWGRPQGAEGTGWIALAIVIFGGWNPIKVAAGAYLFSLLQIMGIHFQTWLPSVPSQVFQVAPFPLMIFTLLIMYALQKESVARWAEKHPRFKPVCDLLVGKAPTALGRPYQP